MVSSLRDDSPFPARLKPTGRDAWIVYTNWKGETARRHILPLRHWFGATAWHGGGQWLLDAHDLERAPGEDRLRTFALAGIHAWAATAEALVLAGRTTAEERAVLAALLAEATGRPWVAEWSPVTREWDVSGDANGDGGAHDGLGWVANLAIAGERDARAVAALANLAPALLADAAALAPARGRADRQEGALRAVLRLAEHGASLAAVAATVRAALGPPPVGTGGEGPDRRR